jgi:hypothetical protein
LFAKERIPQHSEIFSDMFGKSEIDRHVKVAMKEEGTAWTKKNCVGLCAKVAKEVWEEVDEETKEAVQRKIAAIIVDKQKASLAGASTRGAEQFHK